MKKVDIQFARGFLYGWGCALIVVTIGYMIETL